MHRYVPFGLMLLSSSFASAAFVGGTMPVHAADTASARATLGRDVTVFDLYMVFSEADDVLVGFGNASMSALFAGAELVQNGPVGASPDTDGEVDPSMFGASPDWEWDSYVGVGGPYLGASSATSDPDFAFTTHAVTGGWYDPFGGDLSPQGAASDGTELFPGLWAVWGARFVVGGDWTALPEAGIGDGFISARLYEGGIDVMWIDQPGGSLRTEFGVQFSGLPPAPGTAGLFAIAGISAARRRR